MKRPSSPLGIGLWVVGGIVGVYLLGAMALYADVVANNGRIFHNSPEFVKVSLFAIYSPLLVLLQKMGWIE